MNHHNYDYRPQLIKVGEMYVRFYKKLQTGVVSQKHKDNLVLGLDTPTKGDAQPSIIKVSRVIHIYLLHHQLWCRSKST